MENQCDDKKPPRGKNANLAVHRPKADPDQKLVMATPRSGDQAGIWLHRRKTSHDYVEYLSENSTYHWKNSVAGETQSNPPICSIQAVTEISKSQTALLDMNPGNSSSSNTVDVHLDTNSQVKPSAFVACRDNNQALADAADCLHRNVKVEKCDGPSVNFFIQNNGKELRTEHTSVQYQLHTQATDSYGHVHNQSYLHPNMKQCGSRLRSRVRSPAREKTVAADRQRRLRIAERLRELQELLPYTVEGSQLSVLDEIIDHIKYLKLQIQDLSPTRLGGEAAPDPFIFLEGHGHYVLHEEMSNEPLEEMIGNLLEVNPSAADQLLESRGLYMMPMTLVEDIDRAI